jgi:hypothetical protein
MMTLRSLILGGAMLLGAPGLVHAEAPRGELLLSAIDVPLTAAAIEQVGLTEAVTLQVLHDLQRPRYARLRAASALPFFGTDTALAALTARATEDTDTEVRLQAVTSLVWGAEAQEARRAPQWLGALDTLERRADLPTYVRAHLRTERAALAKRTAPALKTPR